MQEFVYSPLRVSNKNQRVSPLVQDSLSVPSGVYSMASGRVFAWKREPYLANIQNMEYFVWPSMTQDHFLWSKNDSYFTRFDWNERLQTWMPFKGRKEYKLGLVSEQSYVLPCPTIYESQRIVKIGSDYIKIYLLQEPPDFSALPFEDSCVIDTSSQSLYLSPKAQETYKGKTVYYNPYSWQKKDTGLLMPLEDFQTEVCYVSPKPLIYEYPLIRIGFRDHLDCFVFQTSEELDSITLEEGQCSVCCDTGELRLSSVDIAKYNVNSFKRNYVFYDGVSLSPPLPLKQATALEYSGSFWYLPLAQEGVLNYDENRPYNGLGSSGVIETPDGTGQTPSAVLEAPVRIGGEDLGTPSSGKVRSIPQGFVRDGDTLFTVVVVNYEDEIPSPNRIATGQCYVCKEHIGMFGSKVVFSSLDTVSEPYFQDNLLTPAYRDIRGQLFSLQRYNFSFDSDVLFTVSIEGDVFTFEIAKGTYSTDEIVALLNNPNISNYEGHVLIQGSDVQVSEDACAELGFLPLSIVREDYVTWNVDSGLGFCFNDLTSFDTLKDYDSTITETLLPLPFVFPTYIPQQTQEDLYFQKQPVGGQSTDLVSYQDVVYRFEEGKFIWVSEFSDTKTLFQPAQVIHTQRTGLIPESLEVEVSLDGTVFAPLDFIYDETSGNILFLDKTFIPVVSGYRGVCFDNVFTDSEQDMSSVSVGDRIVVETEPRQSFFVQNKESFSLSFDNMPDLPQETLWSISSFDSDKAQIVHNLFEPFEPMSSEPVVVKALSAISNTTIDLEPNNVYFVRDGLAGIDAQVYFLKNMSLGLGSDQLQIPAGNYFNGTGFDLLVEGSSRPYSYVPSFTNNPPVIEIDPQGNLNLPSSLQGSSFVYYRENPINGNLSYDLRSSTLHIPLSISQPYLVSVLQDIRVSSLSGSITLSEPLAEGTVVEVSYYLADASGKRVGDVLTETITHLISKEKCTRQTPFAYSFNPSGRTLSNLSKSVYVGTTLQNFGGRNSYSIEGNTIKFSKYIPETESVFIYYSVIETPTSIRTFDLSKKPIYKPPFYIQKGQSAFGLRGDRTQDFENGQMMRLGEYLFYITNAQYYQDKDTTKVSIFPSFDKEIGSRSSEYDTIYKTTKSVSLEAFNFQHKVAIKGQSEVSFSVDLSDHIKANCILEIDGDPYLVSQVNVKENNTFLKLSPVLQKTYSNTTLRKSKTPLYFVGDTKIQGSGEIYRFEPVEVVRFNNSVGSILSSPRDYLLDYATGSVELQEPLNPGDTLYVFASYIKTLKPYYDKGIKVQPRVRYQGLASTTPSGTFQVKGSYQYYAPDSFYVKKERLDQYALGLQDQVLQKTPDSLSRGYLSFDNEAILKNNKDRAFRYLLSSAHNTIQATEQVYEVFEGGIIGDTSGPFRYKRDVGGLFPSSGQEDPITGLLQPFSLWQQVTSSQKEGLVLNQNDPLVVPSSASLSFGVLSGDAPNAYQLQTYLSLQNQLVQNELDDIYMQGILSSGFENQVFVSYPYYVYYYQSPLSRFYPSQIEYHFVTYPGVGFDSSLYTYGRYINGQWISTYNQEIGRIANDVVGSLPVVTLTMQKETVKGFYLSSEGSNLYVSPVDPDTLTLDPETNLPDVSLFVSNGGDIPDLEAPTGDQVRMLRQGVLYDLLEDNTFNNLGYNFVYSGGVTDGCVLTLINSAGDVLPLDQIYLEGQPLVDSIEKGDVLVFGSNTTYRIGTDVQVLNDGRVLDISLPTFQDNSPVDLQESTGQNPPQPLSSLTGVASVIYSKNDPVIYPALQGEFRNDSGQTLLHPEGLKSLFSVAQNKLGNLLESNYIFYYQFPQEIKDSNAFIASESGISFANGGTRASALHTFSDVFVYDTTGQVGLGDARSYDFVFVQSNNTDFSGIFTIGDLGGLGPPNHASVIEFPRFITPTTPPLAPSNQTGSLVKYQLENAVVFLNDTYPQDPQVSIPEGIKLICLDSNGDGVLDKTILDFSSVTSLDWNDGSLAGQGSWNSLWYHNNTDQRYHNKITLKLYARQDSNIQDTPGSNPLPSAGSLIYTIVIEKGEVTVYDWLSVTVNTHTLTAPSSLQFGVTYPSNILPAEDNRQIIIDGVFLDLNATGNTNEWFLPYNETNASLPWWTKESIYGWEFSISVDTYNYDGIDLGGSNTAWVEQDRLTFCEAIDMRSARVRGFTHPLNVSSNLETSLRIREVETPYGASTINDINKFFPITFKRYLTGYDSFIGVQWQPRAGTTSERSYLKVPSIEEGGNIEIDLDPCTISILPTSDFNGEGEICQGFGFCEGSSEEYGDRITEITVGSGSLENINKGDVLIIYRNPDSTHIASTKNGTYLVREVVIPDSGQDYQEVQITTVYKDGLGAVSTSLPVVLSYDGSNVGCSIDPDEYDILNRVYISLNPLSLAHADPNIYKYAHVSFTFGGINANGFSSILDVRWADDSLVSEDISSLVLGKRICGQIRLTLNLKDVGFHDGSVIHGVTNIEIISPSGGSYSYNNFTDSDSPGIPLIGVTDHLPVDNSDFQEDPDSVVYAHVPQYIYLKDAVSTFGSDFNNPNGFPDYLSDYIPEGSKIIITFRKQAGIFVEPSLPTPTQDLAGVPLVVQRDSTCAVGMRTFNDYLGIGTASITKEEVSFRVRRARRFQEQQNISLPKIRDLFEIPRGRVNYSEVLDKNQTLVQADNYIMNWNSNFPAYPSEQDAWNDNKTYEGTNLGGFTKYSVGDVLRFFTDEEEVLAQARIVKINSDVEIVLEGVFSNLDRFELQRSKSLVPLEQSIQAWLEENFELVFESKADRNLNQGGYVSKDNTLEDDNVEIQNVEVGDYIIIDPMGTLDGFSGQGPRGYQGLAPRTGYASGTPSVFDDNRGFYRVTSFENNTIEVNPEHTFSDIQYNENNPYVLLPYVQGEDANALRPTSYKTSSSVDLDSIRPFSYRIYRLRTDLHEQFVDLMLFLRERVLSMIQKIREAWNRYGSYYDFQNFSMMDDLDLGTRENDTIKSWLGVVSVAPFLNSKDCLSLLDWRMFYLKDTNLEKLQPSTDYRMELGSVDPYMEDSSLLFWNDYKEFALKYRDHLRDYRLLWILYRIHRSFGSINKGSLLSNLEDELLRSL